MPSGPKKRRAAARRKNDIKASTTSSQGEKVVASIELSEPVNDGSEGIVIVKSASAETIDQLDVKGTKGKETSSVGEIALETQSSKLVEKKEAKECPDGESTFEYPLSKVKPVKSAFDGPSAMIEPPDSTIKHPSVKQIESTFDGPSAMVKQIEIAADEAVDQLELEENKRKEKPYAGEITLGTQSSKLVEKKEEKECPVGLSTSDYQSVLVEPVKSTSEHPSAKVEPAEKTFKHPSAEFKPVDSTFDDPSAIVELVVSVVKRKHEEVTEDGSDQENDFADSSEKLLEVPDDGIILYGDNKASQDPSMMESANSLPSTHVASNDNDVNQYDDKIGETGNEEKMAVKENEGEQRPETEVEQSAVQPTCIPGLSIDEQVGDQNKMVEQVTMMLKEWMLAAKTSSLMAEEQLSVVKDLLLVAEKQLCVIKEINLHLSGLMDKLNSNQMNP